MAGVLMSTACALVLSVGTTAEEGRSASAMASEVPGFLVLGSDLQGARPDRGLGSAQLTVRDSVQATAQKAGDSGRLTARLTLGVTTYAVEVDKPGLPEGSALPDALAGGVLLDRDVFGGTGIGASYFPRSHAAVVFRGLGRVTEGARVVAARAKVEVLALSAGFHTDDDAFASLAHAREGDTELLVFVSGAPLSNGASEWMLGFDDVSIEVDGRRIRAQQQVPVAGAPEQVRDTGTGGGGAVSFAPVLPDDRAGQGGAGTTSVSSGISSQQERGAGLPASPPVLNDGSQTAPLPSTPQPLNGAPATPLASGIQPLNANPGAVTSLPATPAPLNAAPAQTSALPGSPAPLNASPAPTGAQTATPLPQGIAPLNAAPALPAAVAR